MHLRTLRLRGFKSFPDELELTLEPGVAVVVGPNGSGKSNVADAIVWAAGSLTPSRAASREAGRRPLRRLGGERKPPSTARSSSSSTTRTAGSATSSTSARSLSRGASCAAARGTISSTRRPSAAPISSSCSPMSGSAGRCTRSSRRGRSTLCSRQSRPTGARSSRRQRGSGSSNDASIARSSSSRVSPRRSSVRATSRRRCASASVRWRCRRPPPSGRRSSRSRSRPARARRAARSGGDRRAARDGRGASHRGCARPADDPRAAVCPARTAPAGRGRALGRGRQPRGRRLGAVPAPGSRRAHRVCDARRPAVSRLALARRVGRARSCDQRRERRDGSRARGGGAAPRRRGARRRPGERDSPPSRRGSRRRGSRLPSGTSRRLPTRGSTASVRSGTRSRRRWPTRFALKDDAGRRLPELGGARERLALRRESAAELARLVAGELAQARAISRARSAPRRPSSSSSRTMPRPTHAPPRASATSSPSVRGRRASACLRSSGRSPSARESRPLRGHLWSRASGSRSRRSTSSRGTERAVAAALGRIGSAVLADDARAGLDLLERARDAGLGSLTVLPQAADPGRDRRRHAGRAGGRAASIATARSRSDGASGFGLRPRTRRALVCRRHGRSRSARDGGAPSGARRRGRRAHRPSRGRGSGRRRGCGARRRCGDRVRSSRAPTAAHARRNIVAAARTASPPAARARRSRPVFASPGTSTRR